MTETTTAALSGDEATANLTAPGQLFEIEELDIRGVKTKTWKLAPASLRVVLDMSLGYGDKVYLVYEDERITFTEHYARASTLAQRLIDIGVSPGDRVAIAMRNLPEWVMAFWATVITGAVVVPINAWWTSEELAFGLSDSATKVVFVDSERHERLKGELAGLDALSAVIVANEHRDGATFAGESDSTTIYDFDAFLGAVDPGAAPPAIDIDPEDDATIFYTSGTTGRPKGAVGTHRNATTNLMNMFFFSTRATMRFGVGLADTSGKTQNASLLSVPLFHVTGCQAVLVASTAAGGKLVMMHHFDPERALELIEREQITTIGGVPSMVMALLDSPDFTAAKVASVRAVTYGGAPAAPELVRRISEHFPSGSPSNGYGLTETSAASTMNMGSDYLARPDSVGQPVPVCDAVVLPEDFTGADPGSSGLQGPEALGELWLKGPNVVREYWHRPEANAEAFINGWFRTGDIARIDDEGFIYIVDRAKDMIIRGGENVYCVEVEDALFTHPAVADCAVIGVPHETLGEEVGAAIVLRPGHKISADALALHCQGKIAAFKIPTKFFFLDHPLPRNPQGKVLKRELRDELISV